MLVACGGGGGSGDSDLASVSTEVLTQGSIQRFGSVYVNDIRYSRSATGEVLIDDNPSANEDSLRIGMRVKLRGRYNDDGTGTYDSIEVDNEFKGPIETDSILIPDPLHPDYVGSFVVLGTTVLVAEGVFFDESGPGDTINSLAKGVQEGEGSLGKLLKKEDLHKELVLMVLEIQEASKAMKRLLVKLEKEGIMRSGG